MLNYKTFFPWHLGKLKKVTNGLGFGQSSKKAGAIQKICFILKEPSVIPTLLAHLLRHIVKQCLLFEPTSVNMPSATRSGYSVVETTLKQLENKIYLSKWIHSNYQQSVTFGLYTLFFLKKPTRLEVQIFAVLVLFQSILSGAAKIASYCSSCLGFEHRSTQSPHLPSGLAISPLHAKFLLIAGVCQHHCSHPVIMEASRKSWKSILQTSTCIRIWSFWFCI